jgi:hypothetical protein
MLRVTCALAAVLGAGCLTHPDRIVFDEDFEDCGLCHWSVAGDVGLVSTIHPGEHAARLGPGAKLEQLVSISRGGGYDPGDGVAGNLDDGPWLEYSTDCDVGADLTVTREAAGWAIRLLPGLRSGAGDGSLRRVHLSLPRLDPPDPFGDPPPPAPFTRITIATPAAPCTVDKLRLVIAAPEYGY